MEWTNVFWHLGAVLLGAWCLAAALRLRESNRDVQEAVIPLLLQPQEPAAEETPRSQAGDRRNRSRFVRAVRFLLREFLAPEVHCELALSQVPAELNAGVAHQALRELFALSSRVDLSHAPQWQYSLGGRWLGVDEVRQILRSVQTKSEVRLSLVLKDTSGADTSGLWAWQIDGLAV